MTNSEWVYRFSILLVLWIIYMNDWLSDLTQPIRVLCPGFVIVTIGAVALRNMKKEQDNA